MNILVVLRQVPDAASDLEVTESGLDIDREWLDLRLNDFDDHALEEAVLIKEATGAKVIAMAAAGDGADRLLRTALARGADEAIKIAGDEAMSSRALAAQVADAAVAFGAGLVLTGVQTPDDVFGQLAPYVGGLLGWPHVGGVGGATLTGDAVLLTQEQGGGISVRLQVTLPAVLGIQTATQAPRYVSGTKLRQAASAPVSTFEPRRPALANAAEITLLRAPERRGGAIMLTGTASEVARQLATVLREHGVRT